MIVLKKDSIGFQGELVQATVEYDFEGATYQYPMKVKITTVLNKTPEQLKTFIRGKIALVRQAKGTRQAKALLEAIADQNIDEVT